MAAGLYCNIVRIGFSSDGYPTELKDKALGFPFSVFRGIGKRKGEEAPPHGVAPGDPQLFHVPWEEGGRAQLL